MASTPLDEESVFKVAHKIASPEARADYLKQACDDDSVLRDRLDALLRAHDEERSFLESPPPGLAATIDSPLVEQPGQTIGRYKLLELIGEGGFGAVWMAEQREPVQRKVALKILKAGMDTRQVVARFEAERQALALMDHPNIARVFDGGATASGRPYFVMELVRGVPITRYCDEHQLTPRERLELFLPVCQAIQHAHQKGIIHRDVKPSNVLIAPYDGRPVPKVIDFGVAKATGQRLTEHTQFTGFGTVVGTLEYMSPEQAELNNQDIDTRSDIYSLGVLLYELLTGTTPLSRDRLKQEAFAEMLRIIREEEPPKPSTRLSQSKETLPSISAQRQMEPAKLKKLVRGELDWIVVKALEKDRNRRYETANALALDVQRYLSDEPVQACPPSAGYRLRKFVRRNKAALAVAASLSLLVAVTAIGASVAAIMLHVEQTATRHQLDLTRKAEKEGTNRLFHSLVAQARGNRLSRRLGQRFESLRVLEEATQLARRLNLPEEDFRELRNEVIACLSLPDMRVAKECPSPPYLSSKVTVDEKLDRCAWADLQGNISVHQVAGDKEICRFQTGMSGAWMEFSVDGRFLAAHDGDRVKLWKLVGPEAELIREEPVSINCAFSPDSRLFAVGHADGSIGLFDLPSGKLLRRLAAGVSPQLALAFNPKGGQLAVGSPTSVQVRDLETGKTCVEFHHAPEDWVQVAWHPDGKTVAVFGGNWVVYLGDVATGKQTVKLEGFKSDGIGITFNHAGDLLASTGWEGMLRLWDPHTGQELFRTPGSWLYERHFSPDDHLFAADRKDDKLRLWEVLTSRAYRTLVRDPVLGKGVYQRCAFSPNGRLLVAEMEDGLGFWDRCTGAPLTFVRLDSPSCIIFEASGALLTAGSGSLFRWPIQPDPASSGLVRIGPPQQLPLPAVWSALACTPDGRVVANAQFWGALVWRRDRPDQLIRLTPHHDARYVSVSPDGRWVATGSHENGGAKLWDAATGRLVMDLMPPTPFAVRVGFSPDGKWLAIRGEVCRLWAVDSWEEGPSLGEARMGFAFSPDGRLLALETGQGVVRLVAPDTGREYARLEDPNQDRAGSIVFSPDGTQLVLSGEIESLHVWDLRAIRDELAQRGLDWDLPPYPPAGDPQDAPLLRVTVDLGDMPAKARAFHEAGAANAQAWPLATNPDVKQRDPARAIELARKAVGLAPSEGICWNTLGVAHYRAGHWKDAIEALTKSMELRKGAMESIDAFFLAMAHWQQGEKETAHRYYDRAVRRMAEDQQALEKPEQEEMRRFRAEAAELLGIKEKTTHHEEDKGAPKRSLESYVPLRLFRR